MPHLKKNAPRAVAAGHEKSALAERRSAISSPSSLRAAASDGFMLLALHGRFPRHDPSRA